MRVVRHLLAHKLALLLVLVLLVAQAACDLALPKYTSDIVDVGIQQSGVEHVTCEAMTPDTYDRILADLRKEGGNASSVFEDSYDLEGGRYVLNDAGRGRLDELDGLEAGPLISIHSPEEGDGASTMAPGRPEEVLRQLSDDAAGSILRQRAIHATLSEYEAAGYDLTGMRTSFLARTGAIMLLIAGLGMLVSIMVGFVAARTGAKIGHDLRSRLFGRVVSFSEREVGRFSAASLITRGTNDVQLIQNVSIILMRVVLYAPILAIGGIVMVMATSASLGWIIVVAIVSVFVLVAVLFAFTMPKFRVMQKLIDRVNLVAREMLSGMPVIRAFGRQGYEEERFDEASSRLMRTQLFTNRAMTFMMPTMTLVMNATSVAIVWFGGLGVQDGTLQTGDLIAFITYAMVIIMGFLMLGMIAIILPRANVAAERVDEVISTEPAIKDPPEKPGEAKTGAAGELRGARIEFDSVDFCYDEDGKCENVLSGISFVAEPGETLAIIGPTGSGKSTILKLVERFYDVTSGSIRLDGTDIREMPQSALRGQLGYVPQKSFLFSGTIESNVAYGNEGMPASKVEEALEVAQAKAFVEGKEEGLGFEVSQGGNNVSGGQRQRLAIARAVATEARAFLFDDSFSALDYKTDSLLRDALHRRLGDVTCIIVAQRIATVLGADRIIVLEDGRIVGQGTHSELLETCPEYREIALSQLSEEELHQGGEAA